MAMSYPLIRMVDGPLLEKTPRRAVVEKMAKDLIRFEAIENEQDSIRSLFGNGYSMVDIVMCIDDARQVAMAEIVAKEMGKP